MIVETERLQIREFTFDDAAFIYELLNTPQWIKNIGNKNINNLADAHNYLLNGPLKSYKDNGFGLWAIINKETTEPIGMCGLINRDTLDDIDTGYALLPQFTGKGYAFEAASAVLKVAFETLKLKRVVAITLPENTPSVNLLNKLGMKFEKLFSLPGSTEELMLFEINRVNDSSIKIHIK